MRRLQQSQARDRMGKLIEVLNQLLDARVNESANRAFLVPFAEYQAWNIVQESGPTQAMKHLTRMLALAAEFHDAIEQLQGDKFLPGHHNVGIILTVGSATEEIPRLVNGFGAARQNQGARAAAPVCVRNQFISAGAV